VRRPSISVLLFAFFVARPSAAEPPSFGTGDQGSFGVAGYALAHALWSKSDTTENLCTLSFVDGANGLALERYIADSIDESVVKARQHVKEALSSGSRSATIAYDGFVTTSGRRTEAVILEIRSAASDKVITVAQRYRPFTEKGGFAPIWPVLLVVRPLVQRPLEKPFEEMLLAGLKKHPKGMAFAHP
jgi:hypothetical protein